MLRAGAAATVAVAAATNAATPAVAAPATPPEGAAFQSALDRLAGTVASGVLAEVRDPRWVWRGSSGVRELGTSKPVVPTGRFRVGSVTKSFVATVVLQLAAERRLGLDDPLRRWLPGGLPGGDRVTLRHLLQHTSGIFNYTDVLEELYPAVADLVRIRYRTWSPREILGLIAGRPSLFDPGTSWSYSNTNYILLGLVVERVTGRTYADEIRRRILQPLRLRDAELPGADPHIRGPHSHGYLPDVRDGAVVPVDITDFNPSIAGAAGAMLSGAGDLNRFYGALNAGRLVHEPLLTEMRTSFPDAGYGLGLQTETLPNGVTLWGHTGGIFGYVTYSFSTADGRRQLSLSANPWGDGDPGSALLDLLTAAFPAPEGTAPRAAAPTRIRNLDRREG
ncbi:serine hydrolase [Virgisporangium aliadipatigenens]|uniref:Serine hydrolase n=2 Tax=Virgisporangium aliadipatigenens TaxID=741659 RepID=A0A8J3YQU2_9ACTN|nr:serine hydrolase [Virgisporangium aliadipatigenens]